MDEHLLQFIMRIPACWYEPNPQIPKISALHFNIIAIKDIDLGGYIMDLS